MIPTRFKASSLDFHMHLSSCPRPQPEAQGEGKNNRGSKSPATSTPTGINLDNLNTGREPESSTQAAAVPSTMDWLSLYCRRLRRVCIEDEIKEPLIYPSTHGLDQTHRRRVSGITIISIRYQSKKSPYLALIPGPNSSFLLVLK